MEANCANNQKFENARFKQNNGEQNAEMQSTRVNKLTLFLVAIAGLICFSNGSAVSVAAPPVAPQKAEGGNPIGQLVGYVKDSIVRTIDGTKEMWSNHGRCNEIRAKQKEYREKIKKQWEFENKDLSPQEMKKKLQAINGGITYDEFMFLSKGKEDRGKLMNMLFMMWGAPRLFPYALMFYPDILPAPFQPLPDGSSRETKLEKASRQRSHAVIQVLLALEREAHETPALAKLNIFGKRKQQRTMETIGKLGGEIGAMMTVTGATEDGGARLAMNALGSELYKDESITRKEKRLVGLPQSVVLGLTKALNGPSPLTSVQPNFMRRGTVLTHIQKIAEADKFLVNENVDLGTLSTASLLEACNDRMIGGPARSKEEMQKGLSNWLDLAVVEPSNRIAASGEVFNENYARAILLCYFAVEGVRDARCSSALPRLLFSEQKGVVETDEAKAKKPRRR